MISYQHNIQYLTALNESLLMKHKSDGHRKEIGNNLIKIENWTKDSVFFNVMWQLFLE